MRNHSSLGLSDRWGILVLLPFALFGLSGCERAPSINVVGSFFPVWIFCVLAGFVWATLARVLFVRLKLDRQIKPAVLIYPCIATSCALTLWLLLFS